jgi:tetratricopeptide (TPR) repeat protein
MPTRVISMEGRGAMIRRITIACLLLALLAVACDTLTEATKHNNIGAELSNEGRWEEAIAEFDKAIDLDPDYAMAYYNRGLTYHKLEKHDQAIADYGKAIELDPGYSEAHYNRGHAFFELDEYGLAIADFDKAISLDPDDAEAYVNRGSAYAKLGERDQAIADYEKALTLTTDPEVVALVRENLQEVRGQEAGTALASPAATMSVAEYKEWVNDALVKMAGVASLWYETAEPWFEAEPGSPEERSAIPTFQDLASQARDEHQRAVSIQPPARWEEFHNALTEAIRLNVEWLQTFAEAADEYDTAKLEEGARLQEAAIEALESLPALLEEE